MKSRFENFGPVKLEYVAAALLGLVVFLAATKTPAAESINVVAAGSTACGLSGGVTVCYRIPSEIGQEVRTGDLVCVKEVNGEVVCRPQGRVASVEQPVSSSAVSDDPQAYCHQKQAHRKDYAGATQEARDYARAKCIENAERRRKAGL